MDRQIDADLQADTILHVGFPKCASKTLQTLFAVHEKLAYINNRYTFELLMVRHPFEWNHELAHRAFTQLLTEARQMGTIPVISDERLIGHPHGGFHDAVDIAHRLYALMPNVRVLICIREQFSMLASVYKQAVKEGCTRTVKDYLLAPWDWKRPHFYWQFYKYVRIIELYRSLFGKERVQVMLMEQLRDSPEQFFADLYSLLGVDPCPDVDIHQVHHAGMSDLEAARCRLLNFFASQSSGIRDANPFDRMWFNRPLKQHVTQICSEMTANSVPSITAGVRELFQGRFAAGNRELSALLGIDLAAFGYEVAPEIALSTEGGIVSEIDEQFEIQPTSGGDPYLEHNIVKYKGLLFALPISAGPIDIGYLSPEERERFLHDRNLSTLKRKLEAA